MNAITPETVAFGFLWYVAFLFSTTCHEAAHAVAARWGGDDTAYQGGQLTLNPLPHIEREPVGMVLLPWLSYFLLGWVVGWGSAPYDPRWQQQYPRRAAWMSLAGPAANFALMLLAAGGIWAGVHWGYLRHPEQAQIIGNAGVTQAVNPDQYGFVAALLGMFFVLNLILGTFNLIPVPPLDGHAGITLLLPRKQALAVLDFGRDRSLHFLGTLVAWYVYGRILRKIFAAGLKLLYPEVPYHF